jgi:hypothetical protein
VAATQNLLETGGRLGIRSICAYLGKFSIVLIAISSVCMYLILFVHIICITVLVSCCCC